MRPADEVQQVAAGTEVWACTNELLTVDDAATRGESEGARAGADLEALVVIDNQMDAPRVV